VALMGIDPVSLAINAALIAANAAVTASQKFEGPRLDDLKVTTADYGTPLNYCYGTRRFDGVSCIWAEPLREVKRQRKTKGGKFNEYTYYGTWAVAVCDHETSAVTRIWFDRNLIYDATSGGPISPFSDLGDITQYITIYLGTDDQDVDPRMSATVDAEFGADSTPAYRGVTYIVFKDLPLEKLGNRLPQVSVEVTTNGADAFPYDRRTATHSWGSAGKIAFSPDRSRILFGFDNDYEIWDVSARALMIGGDLDETLGDLDNGGIGGGFAITADGTIYAGGGGTLYAYGPDGLGAQAVAATGIDLAAYLLALTDGNGKEWIFCGSHAQGQGGKLYDVLNDDLVDLDPSTGTGSSWDIKWGLVDGYGDLWVLGGEDTLTSSGPLDGYTLALWRVVNTSGRAGPDYAFVTMPVEQPAIVDVSAVHNTANAHFVVRWVGGGLYTIDDTTFAITGSAAISIFADNNNYPFAFATPSDATIWLDNEERSLADLSLVRSIDPTDWHADAQSAPLIYDRINHALITDFGGDDFGWLYLDRKSGDGVTLRSIVENVAERSGLTVANDIDATDLTQTVQGYSWTQGQGKAILEPLLEAYDSEARPHDFKIEFLRRGDASLGTIDVADMGAGGSVRYEVATTLDTDLPLKASLTFADIDRDQQPNTALAQRSGSATDSRRELSLDATTLVLDADEARQMADGYLRRTWMKAQEISLSVSRKYSKLEPGDVYSLTLDDVSRTAKLTRLEFGANGVLSTSWERYAASVHTPTTLAGAPADGLIPAVLPTFGYTKGLVLDIPLVTDGDDGIIAYAAAAPYSDTAWPGAIIWRSLDGIDYDIEFVSVSTSQEGSIGYASDVLPDALSTVWDRASSVTVTMFAGELTSATEAEVSNGANLALIGDELIGFTTATLIATGTYTLSGFLRGQRGTEWATGTHAAGDRFVLMETARRGELEASDIGDALYFKPITNGGSTGFAQSFTYTAASRKPYSPAHAAANDDGTDITIEWVRRTRLGGSWRDYMDASLGETAEEYEVDILNAGGTVLRTYDSLSTPEAVYTNADQTTDSGLGVTAKIYQIAPDLTLRGYPATVAI
jgi:hypothetical protein